MEELTLETIKTLQKAHHLLEKLSQERLEQKCSNGWVNRVAKEVNELIKVVSMYGKS